ncbi:MAG: carbohydrate ABC transporter permease [Halobacteriales archaeon]
MSVATRLRAAVAGDEEISTVTRVGTIGALTLAAFLVAVPLYWMVATSLKTAVQINAFPPHIVPPTPTIEPYVEALRTGPWVQWFLNTAVISSGSTLFVLAFATPAAYVLARREFPGSKPIYVMFIGILMIPAQILLIPLYTLFSRYGLINTRIGLIIAYSAFFLGFVVFLLHSFFTNLPDNVEDAARIGGVPEWRTFLRVVLPMAKPGIATAAIFVFVFTWNEFLFALTFLQTPDLYTISVGLQEFQGLRGTVVYNQMFAMSTLATLPVVILFAIFSEQFIKGMAGLNLD